MSVEIYVYTCSEEARDVIRARAVFIEWVVYFNAFVSLNVISIFFIIIRIQGIKFYTTFVYYILWYIEISSEREEKDK